MKGVKINRKYRLNGIIKSFTTNFNTYSAHIDKNLAPRRLLSICNSRKHRLRLTISLIILGTLAKAKK